MRLPTTIIPKNQNKGKIYDSLRFSITVVVRYTTEGFPGRKGVDTQKGKACLACLDPPHLVQSGDEAQREGIYASQQHFVFAVRHGFFIRY